MNPRILDATLWACWQTTTEPLDRDSVAALTDVLPLHGPGLGGIAPLVAPGAYGHDALLAAARRATAVAPIDDAAIASLHELDDVARVVAPAPRTSDTDANRTAWSNAMQTAKERFPDTTWEHRLIVDASDGARLPDTVTAIIDKIGPTDRLRVEDPHGTIDLRAATQLAAIPDRARLTVMPSNARGLATAIAHTLLSVPDGATVVTTLLGRAPRGAPSTEHLVDADLRDRLRPAAETVALATGRPIDADHPYWGNPLIQHPDPTRAPRPDTLHVWVQHHLDEWGIELTLHEHESLMTALRARIRPGDRLEGPILWATLATITDLRARATAGDAP